MSPLNKNSPTPFSSKADDWDYPMDMTFSFLPFPEGELVDIHRTWQRLKPLRHETHEVHNQQERVELYLRVLRQEYAAGRFDLRLESYQRIVDRYDEQRHHAAAEGFVTGGTVRRWNMKNISKIQDPILSEKELVWAEACHSMDQKLRAMIDQPDQELLREDPQHQIVNEFYGTFAEKMLFRTYFSHIKVHDPLRFKRADRTIHKPRRSEEG